MNRPAVLPQDASAVPTRAESTIGLLLRTRAHTDGDRVFAHFDRGASWTYADAWQAALRVANGLAALGVDKGDTVACWLPNGPECIATWFGANLLGATFVPINTAYRGSILEHALRNAGASVIVAHADLIESLDAIDPPELQTVVTVGGTAATGYVLIDFEDWADDAERDVAVVDPWDPQMIIFTSGTTGPSKGVVLSYVHHYSCAVAAFDRQYSDGESYLVHLPLYHVGGTMGVYAMLLYGGTIVVQTMFRTTNFWEVVRTYGVTSCTLLGVMATFLLKQPTRPDDADNPLRWIWMVPLVDDSTEFAERFGVDVYTMYNMTEVSCPLVSEKNPTTAGVCGRPRPGIDVRLVDENDLPVARGQIGELVIRAARPWSLNSGYNAMPEATAQAWRNGWFHTGDAMYEAADGQFSFVDRMKDTIRRRGENISSFEVENEAVSHPDVAEAAALAVPSEFGEDEVLLAVAPLEGHVIDPPELLTYLKPRMAHFMVPRYIRILEALPKTPTNKVRKVELRDEGLTSETWDREAAGIQIRQTRVGQ